jgi:hypothetical protein
MPFWATNSVGIDSDAGSVCLTLRVTVCSRPLVLSVTFFFDEDGAGERAEVAVRGQGAENGTWGRVSSKLVTG